VVCGNKESPFNIDMEQNQDSLYGTFQRAFLLKCNTWLAFEGAVSSSLLVVLSLLLLFFYCNLNSENCIEIIFVLINQHQNALILLFVIFFFVKIYWLNIKNNIQRVVFHFKRENCNKHIIYPYCKTTWGRPVALAFII